MSLPKTTQFQTKQTCVNKPESVKFKTTGGTKILRATHEIPVTHQHLKASIFECFLAMNTGSLLHRDTHCDL